MPLHPDEVPVDAALVRALLRRQHPRWADLPLTPVVEHGTDHRLFRLGPDLVARMPVIGWAADQAASDARWLPHLAPHLPVAVPAPVALGEPDLGYPHRWSVAPWLPGAPPMPGDHDPEQLATDLAAFVRALRAVPVGSERPEVQSGRARPLADWDEAVRRAVAEAGERLPGAAAVLEAWEHCLSADPWGGDPAWFHGDLLPGNLLVRAGRLSAVIDFGTLGVGDPAPDLLPAWAVVPTAREVFRRELAVDDATWLRGQGWALAPALTGIPYYWESAPAFAERGLRTVARVLEDLGSGS